MLMRAALLYVLFVFVVLTSGFAFWQSLEVRARDEKLADAGQSLIALRRELQAAKDNALSLDRRARMAEHDLRDFQQSHGSDSASAAALRADLAAARQQLSAAETAVTEAEAVLAAEIAAHAALKSKTADLAAQLAGERAKSEKAVAAAEAAATEAKAKAEAARQGLVKIEPQPSPPLAAKPASAVSAPATALAPTRDGAPVTTQSITPAPQPAKTVTIEPARLPPHKSTDAKAKSDVSDPGVTKKAQAKPVAKRPEKKPVKAAKSPSAFGDFPF